MLSRSQRLFWKNSVGNIGSELILIDAGRSVSAGATGRRSPPSLYSRKPTYEGQRWAFFLRELEAPPEAAGSSSERGGAACIVRLAAVAHLATTSVRTKLVMWKSGWECAGCTGRSTLPSDRQPAAHPICRRSVACQSLTGRRFPSPLREEVQNIGVWGELAIGLLPSMWRVFLAGLDTSLVGEEGKRDTG